MVEKQQVALWWMGLGWVWVWHAERASRACLLCAP